MAEDASAKEEPVNLCCANWKERYSKLKEKQSRWEQGRDVLRQTVKILEQQVDKFQSENVKLKKECKEEKQRADHEEEERKKELAICVSLEKEVSALKSQIISLEQQGSVTHDAYEAVKILKLRVSDGETEINNLKDLVQKERKRADSEKKKAEAEKKKANEASQSAKKEKNRADEEKRVAQIARNNAEEIRLQLEKEKGKADEARSKLVLQMSKSDEADKKLATESQNTIKERRRAALETVKAGEQRELAEMHRKKAVDEKSRADSLSQQLEQYRRRIEELQSEIDRHVKISDNPDSIPCELTNAETRNAKEELRLHQLKFKEANKKLEEVKQKATREKKRADLKMIEAEENRKVAEAYRKQYMEEKHRVEELNRQLEYHKKSIEKLKEVKEIASSRALVQPSVFVPDNITNPATANMKLLMKQLKFEKKQVKLAKQMAKLEVNRNNILQQELRCLKQEFIQFSEHINLLDNFFLPRNEGIHDLAKIDNISNKQRLKLKRKLFGIEPYQVDLDNGNELGKPSCTTGAAMDAFDSLKPAIDYTATLLHGDGFICPESITGTDSKLDPQLRGCKRKMLQSSAINSNMASFSDRPLVGSQEEGAFSATTSVQLAEEKLNPLSGEATKRRYNDNHAVVAENSIRSPINVDAVMRKPGQSKTKKTFDAVETIERLYNDSHKWHLVMAENLSLLHGILGSEMDKHVNEGRCLVPNLDHDSHGEHNRPYKKRKASDEAVGVQHLSNCNENKKLGTDDVEEANALSNTLSLVCSPKDTSQACKDGTGNFFMHNKEDSGNFTGVVDGNFMKLLDLDSDDEKRYRLAVTMPLSPSLPEIELQNCMTLDIDDSQHLGDGIFNDGYLDRMDNPGSSFSFDVIDVEIDSNNVKINTGRMFHDNDVLADPYKLPSVENGPSNVSSAGDTYFKQICEPDVEPEASDNFVSGYERSNITCASRLVSVQDNFPKFCVVFSDNKDSSSLFKITSATRSCMAWLSMLSETDQMVRNITLAVLKVEDLLPRETLCVFFSLLLLSISAITTVSFLNFLDGDLIGILDLVAEQMLAAMSDVVTSNIFVKFCDWDELLRLTENFLMDKRVLVFHGLSSKLELAHDSENVIVLNGDIVLSFQTASDQQLVAGSIILASVCTAVNQIGFVCEISYNILRKQRNDSTLSLIILHVFAYLCGSNYFTLGDYHLTMIVIKSLVTFAEKTNILIDSNFCNPFVTEAWSKFPACTKCPFSESAISMDKVVSLLLDKLQHQITAVNSLNTGELPLEDKSGVHASYGEATSVACMNCKVVCSLSKFGMPTVQSSPAFDGTLCFSDILSLTELVACYMRWNWTFENIVCQLLKMLESCVLENLLASIIVLLGQLGRLGVDANGYEDSGVLNLRCRLSDFLCQSGLRRLGLPVQIATVCALLGLVPHNFEELVKNDAEFPSSVVRKSNPTTDCVRKWFSTLSDKQQSLSLTLLHSSSCKSEGKKKSMMSL